MNFHLLMFFAAAASAAWTPTYFDDFSMPTLDPTLWRVADNYTHGNQEWQLYLKDEVYIENGSLVIRTRSRNASYGRKPYRFTSGWVDTKGAARGENTFGMFSARVQMPHFVSTDVPRPSTFSNGEWELISSRTGTSSGRTPNWATPNNRHRLSGQHLCLRWD